MLPARRFGHLDHLIANLWWGADCGPVALAAILGLRLGDVRRLIPEGKPQHALDTALLPEIIRCAGRSYRLVGQRLPEHGIALIKFGGWRKQPAHWVAVSGSHALDSTSCRWVPALAWLRFLAVLSILLGGNGRWWVYVGIEVE
jgi:hypothetical protein